MYIKVISSIVILVGLICLAMLFRKRGFLQEEEGKLFSRLVISVTLPALIFYSLARTPIKWKWGILVLIMLGAEILCLILAWFIGRIMKLENPQLGAMILTAGFGSSSLMGYALISEVFPGNALAITEATVISELGVGPALFTIGVMIAIYFGSKKAEAKDRFQSALKFFKSPIFLSIIAGILWSTLKLPTDTPVISTIFSGIKVVASANTFCVAFTVGLLLHFQGLRTIAKIAGIVALIKLIMKPIIIWLPSLSLSLTPMQMQVLILEAAMPSAMLTVVIANKYGCDGRLASKIVFATSIASIATILIMFSLLT